MKPLYICSKHLGNPYNPSLTGNAGLIALLAANLYVFCFGFSWGPVVWVMLGEMFNNRIRGAALSVAACAQWIANFAVSTTFSPLKDVGLGFAYGFGKPSWSVFVCVAATLVIKEKLMPVRSIDNKC